MISSEGRFLMQTGGARCLLVTNTIEGVLHIKAKAMKLVHVNCSLTLGEAYL